MNFYLQYTVTFSQYLGWRRIRRRRIGGGWNKKNKRKKNNNNTIRRWGWRGRGRIWRRKKRVGLIVERTFRDSSQPLAFLKTFPFTRRPINLNRPNFPTPSPSLRNFDKTYGSPVLSMGLSFDKRPDETLTGEKYVWHLVENHFSTLDNADPQKKEKPTDIKRRFQNKKKKKQRRPKSIRKSIRRAFTYDTIRFLRFFDWQSRTDRVRN